MTDHDRTLGVVQDVVANAAQDGSAQRAHTARPDHDQCGVAGDGHVHDGLAQMAVVVLGDENLVVNL